MRSMKPNNFITVSQFSRAIGTTRQNVYALAQHLTIVQVGGRLAIPKLAAKSYCDARALQYEEMARRYRSAAAEIMFTELEDEEDDTTADL